MYHNSVLYYTVLIDIIEQLQKSHNIKYPVIFLKNDPHIKIVFFEYLQYSIKIV